MKIFSREFWGSVLIWLGVLIFIVVLYDAVRPYFPDRSRYPVIADIQSALRSISSGRESRPETARPPRRMPPPRRPASPADRSGMLTTSIHQTEGNYNLWVWEILPDRKTSDTVRVEIAHAAEGKKGGFFIVAYADTDGDGKPDKEIARSDFLAAERPGEWSSFIFSTPEKRIFVGNTWPPDSDAVIYRSNGSWPGRNNILAGRFYHTISSNEANSAGPAFTNMRISFPPSKDK